MSRNNDVFQVLVVNEDTVATAGTDLDALLPGQIGAFDFDTNKAISTATNKFYLAVGVDRDGDGITDDIVKSSGTHIQTRNIVSVSGRCYTPAQPKIVELTDFTANCGEEYGVKFEIRNQQAYRVNGFNQVVKSFVVMTDKCTGCEDCAEGSCIDLASTLMKEVNLDPDKLILAEMIATSAITIATHGTAAAYAIGDVVTEADAEALKTFNATADEADKVCLGLRFTVQAKAFQTYCGINLNYFSSNQTDILPVAIGGFLGKSVLTVTQDMVFEEGDGVSVAQLEYEAGGWNGKPGPYRVSSDGLPRVGMETFADAKKKYHLIHLSYDQASIAGWMEHKNNLRTIIAVEQGSEAALIIPALMDALAETQFKDLSDYLLTCASTGLVNKSVDPGEPFVDGIGTV